MSAIVGLFLKLLTGRAPVDPKRLSEEGFFASWPLPWLTDRQKVVQIMDPALEVQFSKAAIAAMCVQPKADYRPLMADAVQSQIPLVKTQRPKLREPPRSLVSHVT